MSTSLYLVLLSLSLLFPLSAPVFCGCPLAFRIRIVAPLSARSRAYCSPRSLPYWFLPHAHSAAEREIDITHSSRSAKKVSLPLFRYDLPACEHPHPDPLRSSLGTATTGGFVRASSSIEVWRGVALLFHCRSGICIDEFLPKATNRTNFTEVGE